MNPSETLHSNVCLIDSDGSNETVIYSAPAHFEAPNWSSDGDYLLLNKSGLLWKLDVHGGGGPEQVDTGSVANLNNDHGISPDGWLFVISAGHIYLLPATGGEPKQITSHTPSYYHGWSPDGQTLAYCAERDGIFNIYSIPLGGGEETRLTFGGGMDDGPDYSPDGHWIYFNSNRTGKWSIWRIPATGDRAGDSLAEQITTDSYEDWFPHPSPDGRSLVFLSYPPGTKGHPPNKDVVLRRMPIHNGVPQPTEITEIAHVFGGQGTINVNSWSPDSRRFAFVKYSFDES